MDAKSLILLIFFVGVGVEELEVTVDEPNWSRKWEEITSLNMKYSALLSVIHE